MMFFRPLLLLAACALSADPAGRLGQSEPSHAVAERPHILLAIADDWGWPHAGSYGDPVVQTPAFDRVAREGVLFTHAFVASPSCTPSRAALLTGQWHWRLEESANLWSTLQSKFPVYPDLLEESGYHVGSMGKGWGPGQIEPGGRMHNPAGAQFDSFKDFLFRRPGNAPFCFWFGSEDPHRPYEEGIGERSGIPVDRIEPPAFLPAAPEVRSDIADYYWEVQRFDRQLGEILAELERRGELDNTLIVVTGDNGMPFPRAKANLYDGGTRVPLAIRWPKMIRAAGVVDDLVSLTDLAPTFLEAAGLQPGPLMTGQSLMEILTAQASGKIDGSRDSVLLGKERHVPCQEAPDSGGTPMRAIRTDEHLYVVNFRPDRWPAGTPRWQRAYLEDSWYGDIDNGPSKFFMFQHRHEAAVQPLFSAAFEKRPGEELYDLKKDPDQLVNVAADPSYAPAKARLSARLFEHLRASHDPRILGSGDRFDEYPYYGGTPNVPDFLRTKERESTSVRWEHLSSRNGELPVPHPESKQQTGALVGDFDGDGATDFVIAYRHKAPALVWYRFEGKHWDRQVIEPDFLTVEAGGAAFDIDGDGDLDIVFGSDSQNSELWWWENPAPRFAPAVAWKRRVIKKGGANQHHDQVFGDFLGTGKPQLVFWNQKAGALFLAEIPSDPRRTEPWPYVEIYSGRAGEGIDKAAQYAEGAAAFDIDGDGRTDLLAGNYWFKHEKENEFLPIPVGRIGGRIAAGHFKPGKVAQVVIAPGDGSGPLMLYECHGTPTDPAAWKGRDLLDREMVHGHTLDLGDVNGDGNLDIFAAEMAKWTQEPVPADHPQATAWILYGDGKGNFSRTELVVGHGWHEGKLADLDGDGDLDILNKPYTWDAPRVDIWLNHGTGPQQAFSFQRSAFSF